MWPIMLDITRDECRGILRRLELETYANLMSSFRAQGGLNDSKIKILEELRSILHISIDRHRAEARRVANDEQLCTVAESLFGPNSHQEWSREGRRPFPILPRGPAYTALTSVADKASEITTADNSQLPHPAETRRLSVLTSDTENNKNIVTQDPTKLAEEKLKLKRSLSSPSEQNLPQYCKKRPENNKIIKTENSIASDSVIISENQIHTNTRIQQLYHTHSKTQSRHKKAAQAKRGKGRPSLNRLDKSEKKSGEKGSQSFTTLTVDTETPNNSIISTTPVLVANLQNNQVCALPLKSPQISTTTEIYTPQIATSKKDIATNLSKLNLTTPPTPTQTILPFGSPEIQSTPINISAKVIQPQSTPSVKLISAHNIKTVSNITKTIPGKVLNTELESPVIISNKVQIHTPQQQQQQPSQIIQQSQYQQKPTIIPITINPSNIKTITSSPIDGNIKIFSPSPSTPTMSEDTIVTQISKPLQKINNSNNKVNKIQILNQQIIESPTAGKTITTIPPIRLTPQNNIQLKTLQSKNQIKILPSSIGKVLIKSAQPTTSKMSGITPIKNPSTPNTNNTITNLGNLQKVHLMPIKNNSELGKSNLIVMQKFNQLQTSTPLRGVKLAPKEMNKIIVNTKNVIPIKTSNLSPNNVFVVGISDQTDKNTINLNYKNSSVITEDTPVDIVPSLPTTTHRFDTDKNLNLNGELLNSNVTVSDLTSDIVNKSNKIVIPNISTVDSIKQITDWEDELDHANKIKYATQTQNIHNNQNKKIEIIDEKIQENIITDGNQMECDENKMFLMTSTNEGDENVEINQEDDDFIEEDQGYENFESTEMNEEIDESITKSNKSNAQVMEEVERAVAGMHGIYEETESSPKIMTINELITSGHVIPTDTE